MIVCRFILSVAVKARQQSKRQRNNQSGAVMMTMIGDDEMRLDDNSVSRVIINWSSSHDQLLWMHGDWMGGVTMDAWHDLLNAISKKYLTKEDWLPARYCLYTFRSLRVQYVLLHVKWWVWCSQSVSQSINKSHIIVDRHRHVMQQQQLSLNEWLRNDDGYCEYMMMVMVNTWWWSWIHNDGHVIMTDH